MNSKSAPPGILELVARYEREQAQRQFTASDERGFRRDYIEPLLDALGWSVGNGLKQNARLAQDIEFDYLGFYQRGRRFGVEVKLPTQDLNALETQVKNLLRRSSRAGLAFIVLTNFAEFVCYDCEAVPSEGEPLSDAEVLRLTFEEYASRWPELSSLVSREALEGSGFQAQPEKAFPEGIETDLEEDSSPPQAGTSPLGPLEFSRSERSVLDLHRDWKGHRLDVYSNFQRGLVWSLDEQARFIESVLLRIPLPAIYIAEQETDSFHRIVIDGQQRLLTVFGFLEGDFALSGLTLLPELNGKHFHDLESKRQRRFEDALMPTVIIRRGSDPRLAFELCLRLNPTWNAQKVRHVLYRGAGLQMVEQLAAPEGLFRHVAGLHRRFRRMHAEELVLRMLAFLHRGPYKYTNTMSAFLTEELLWLNELPREEREHLHAHAEWTLHIVRKVFGEKAFRRFDASRQSYSQALNASLMDVMTWGFVAVKADWEALAEKLRLRSRELQSNKEFVDSISSATNSVAQVRTRFHLWKEMLSDVASDHS
jgi:hypothetical protein